MNKIIISIITIAAFVCNIVVLANPDNEIPIFFADRSLLVLRATENASFARYQTTIQLNDLKLPKGELFTEEEQTASVSTLPLVVVAIPTFNRPQFLLQSLEYVRRQQYPRNRITVAILDDSSASLESSEAFLERVELLNEVGIKVFYKHRIIVPEIGQENIGQKRNSIVRWIKKDLITNEKDFVIIHWDDDDWQAPHRISKQVLPLMNGQSDMSALDLRTILILDENQIYSRQQADGRTKAQPIMSINGGTLCYWASVWNEDTKFPSLGCGEDIMFVDRVINSPTKKYRLTTLDDSDVAVIYLRHEGNTWGGLDPSTWSLLDDKNFPPRFKKDAYFYKEMQKWKKPIWSGKFQQDEEPWICSSNIDEVKTIIVNEIRHI
jgi:glycosyltransferase involved in cell wall biosynthesis